MTDGNRPVITPGGPRARNLVHAVSPGQVVRRTPEGSYIIRNVEQPQGGAGGPAAEEEFVVTPGGLRPKALVHRIEPGMMVAHERGMIKLLHPTGEVAREFGPAQMGGIPLGAAPFRTPGVPLLPRNLSLLPEVVPAFGSGWITYASWNNGTGNPISCFTTTWVVPPAPSTQSGQTIFLFNGIENSTNIYQPVLQWGPSGAGGGNSWNIASWYVGGPGMPAFHTNLIAVNPGDVLTGVMTLTGSSAAGSSYNCEFQGVANTSLPIANVEELFWAIETLEAYNITQCSDYPNTGKTPMASISMETTNATTGSVTHPDFTWTINNTVTDCGQHTLYFDDATDGAGEVDLWYSNSPFWTVGPGTLAPFETQKWWFGWGGNGDVGPQFIQAEPLDAPDKLDTVEISEGMDGNGHLTYYAVVRNSGPNTVRFIWRGGGR